MTSYAYKQSRGAGLIEVLVTMLILATTLLALSALQTRSLQYNQGAYFRSQANILAYDILDRIRVNKGDIAAYSIAVSPFNGTIPTSPRASVELAEWRRDIDSNLPGASSGITCDGDRVCTVTIVWK